MLFVPVMHGQTNINSNWVGFVQFVFMRYSKGQRRDGRTDK